MSLSKPVYRRKVKSVWRLRRLNPKMTLKQIATQLKMDSRNVKKILSHKYRDWYLDEITDWAVKELIKRNSNSRVT